MTTDRRANPRSILVVGGTRKMDLGNRLLEKEEQLNTPDHEVVMQYLQDVENAGSVDELGKVLLNLAANRINLVGSRGICYSSAAIAHEILHRQDPRLVTRTGNLRMKYYHLTMKEAAGAGRDF